MPVYFIQSANGTGPIKIGYTRTPYNRVREIQRMSPYKLTLLKVIEGDKEHESKLHLRFRHIRLHGEWFEPDDSLIEFIKDQDELPIRQKSIKKTPPQRKKSPPKKISSIANIDGLLDSVEAATYIDANLKKRGLKGWKNPISSLGVAVKKGQIQPVKMPGDENLKRTPKRFFTREECDKLIKSYRKPGNQHIDLSSILDRLGQVPDAELAEEIGVSARTIARERQRRWIKSK